MKTTFQVGIICALSFFSSPVFAYEQCRYPIKQIKELYWMKDVHGLTNVNTKETLRDAQPVVTCVQSGLTFPECSTPWKGLVHVEKVSDGNWYHIGGFRDKSNNMLVFSLYRDGSSYSPMQIQPSQKSEVVRCGSLVVNRWVQVQDYYDVYYYLRANELGGEGMNSDGSRRIWIYENISSDRSMRIWIDKGRRVLMRTANYVMYGPPARMHEGATGNF